MARSKAAADASAVPETVVEPVPQVNVVCTNPACPQNSNVKSVDAGVMLGNGVIMYGTFACLLCGGNLELVQ